MNLQPSKPVNVNGDKQFLRNSVGAEYKTGGATLDYEAFAGSDVVNEDGYVLAGTAVFLDEDSGLYRPWSDFTPPTPPDVGEEGGDDEEFYSMIGAVKGAGLTSHDVKLVAGSNPIVGVLIAGHPIENKCHGVNEAFREAVRGYLRFDA